MTHTFSTQALADRSDQERLVYAWTTGLRHEVHPVFGEAIGTGPLHHALREHVQAQVRAESSRDRAARQQQHHPAPGAELDDYLPKVLEIPGLGPSLVALRFKGLRTDAPFVDLLHGSQPLTEPALVHLCRATQDIYRRVQPLWLRTYQGSHHAQVRVAGTRGDQRLVAGHIPNLRRTALPSPDPTLRVSPCTSPEATYRHYMSELAAFLAENPAVGAELWPSSQEEFRRLATEGCIRDAWLGDRWAGVIASDCSADFWGILCHVIFEEFLAAHARGRGLAPVMQQRFIADLDVDRSSLVAGTIHATNEASLRTALKVGRIDVGGFDFHPLSQPEGMY